MCGICGMVGRPDEDAVRRMTRAMSHRGPDDESYFVAEQVALGFRRLAIIDVRGGRQPLSNEDGSIQVVFNGEIYNHRTLRAQLEERGHTLNTGSDGEVLSHLYEDVGDSLVEQLNGIFAFALWDSRREKLVLARDPHGVKPLYYAEQDGRIVFASEIKALVASGCLSNTLDPEAVAQYLTYQAVPSPRSILSGVEALPPGRVAQRPARRAERAAVLDAASRKRAADRITGRSVRAGARVDGSRSAIAAHLRATAGRLPIGRRRFKRDCRDCRAARHASTENILRRLRRAR